MDEAPRSIFGRTVDELPDDDLARPDIPAQPIEHPRGERLRFRLQTASRAVSGSAGALAGAAVAAAGSICVVAAIYLMFAYGPAGLYVAIAVVGGFVAVSGFGILIAGIGRLASSRTPAAIIEIDREELRPGESVRMLVIQRAPADLESLTVSLACERSVLRMVTIREEWIDENDRRHPAVRVPRWDSSMLRSERVFREENLTVRSGHDFEREMTFRLPEDLEASASSKNQRFEWYFEVDAVARTAGSYTDRYAIVVRPRSYSA